MPRLCRLQVVHVFSHIHQTYVVYTSCVKDAGSRSENVQWLTRSALQEAAVSTGVKKVLGLCERVCVHGELITNPESTLLLQILKLRDSTLGQQGAPAGVRKPLVSS